LLNLPSMPLDSLDDRHLKEAHEFMVCNPNLPFVDGHGSNSVAQHL